MGDENPIRTLGDYSKPSHEGYRNTIELPIGNNVVPFRSDTIRLVQNGCSFHGLRSEDPNQHLKDFLKLVDSLNLDGDNRERTRLQSLSEAWTRFKDLLQKVPHHGIDLWLQVQILYDHVNPVTRQTIDQSAGGKLRDLNAKESWALLEDLSLYDNKSWNDPKDFAKPVKAITLPQDVLSTSDRRLIKLENQVQRLMEAYLAMTQPTQVNKITTSSFAYECDFMILEDTTSIIDRCLGEMVFGRPFIDKTGLVYDKEEGTVSFKQDNEKIIFKMPHTMEIFKQTRFMGASTDSIPPLTYEENFSSGRTHYYQSLLIGDEYRQDEGDRRGIRHLMRLEKEMMNEGEVTFIDERSLEVLRCFSGTIMDDDLTVFAVSSPLLSTQGITNFFSLFSFHLFVFTGASIEHWGQVSA
ncbi:hypothetical protein Tco_0838330 [Tanacetum coccineum]|uniref:MAK10-like protein n=1 Tax=Tanacetum coccineum TaxID=301880 RepID=A0ABQ5ARJ2_9ASTR